MSDGHLCSICFQAFEEYGHSAKPVNDGRCCNRCQSYVVIPVRIRTMREQKQQNEPDIEEVQRL
jgi:hypothetical protein